jgi:toxin FitB
MFLLDTNILSERRKGANANPGVVDFVAQKTNKLYLPVQVVGEIRSGIEGLRRRGDLPQARRLEAWLDLILDEFSDQIVEFNLECAKTWGYLMGVNDQHIVDRQIAAMALVYDLTVVTGNTSHFEGTGVRLLNPFAEDGGSLPKPASGRAKPRKAP